MLVNQRAECRFSIHFVVFFVLCACCFAYSLVLYFFNISFGLLWGREFFKGSSNFCMPWFCSDILASVRGLFSRDVG